MSHGCDGLGAERYEVGARVGIVEALEAKPLVDEVGEPAEAPGIGEHALRFSVHVFGCREPALAGALENVVNTAPALVPASPWLGSPPSKPVLTATSGAGTAFTVAFYGTDQYIIQYDYEIGPPWDPKAWETYQKISYPFLHADRIKTPTLFLGGERDFNVPVQGSQQMYQALRSLGVDTQLVIYPNENHGITRPSYVRDRMERYLAWYDKYLKKSPDFTNASGPSKR